MLEAQVAAVRVLERVAAGRSLDSELTQVNAAPHALVQALCYGVLRELGALDAALDALLDKPLTDEAVRGLLRVALYQLQHMRAAPHAVVDHAVRASAALNAGAAKGLVNAVLRNYLRRRAEVDAKVQAAARRNEVARFSFPQWWIDKLRAQWPQHYAGMLTAGNRHAPMTLRVNRRRGTREAYLARLGAQGIAARAVDVEADAVVLDKPLPVAELPGFSEGLVSVQDASAQRAAPLLDVHDGMRVLDACAAPGGKSAHILEIADVTLTALDVDAARVARIEAGLARLGLTATVRVADCTALEAWWDGQPFERILADVPCSGSGVARRHPDIKWLRRAQDLPAFARRQVAILDALWFALAPGGKLLYVTCSMFAEENGAVVDSFCAQTPRARRIALPDGAPAQLLPGPEHDGFFFALLEKAA